MIGVTITAILLLLCGTCVVRATDLVRMVLWLGATLVITAVAYVELGADLLAGLQILLYTGGIVTLMLFAVLLTWQKQDGKPSAQIHNRMRGAVCSLFLLGGLIWTITGADLLPGTGIEPDSAMVGSLFLTRHVLAFEALSVLLLAVMVGAIVLSRRSDP
jgi:NADH-quinone oxidoreductase subunit J